MTRSEHPSSVPCRTRCRVWLIAAFVGIGVLVWSWFLFRSSDVPTPDSSPPQYPGKVRALHTRSPQKAKTQRPVVNLRAKVVASYPHDVQAFTQGLLWHAGRVYESTGLHGRSSLRQVDLVQGKVLRRVSLQKSLFAEGLARVGNTLVQLTWQQHKALVWSLDHFKPLREYTYDGEGWGLCFNGRHLVMSDGSDRLFFRDPKDFRQLKVVRVQKAGKPLYRLNELECVGNWVFANIWGSFAIAKINASTGKVIAMIDASGLLTSAQAKGADVLNGIAWIPERRHFLLTGKLWPRMFEVIFEE